MPCGQMTAKSGPEFAATCLKAAMIGSLLNVLRQVASWAHLISIGRAPLGSLTDLSVGGCIAS